MCKLILVWPRHLVIFREVGADPYISGCRPDRSKIPTSTAMLLGFWNSIMLMQTLSHKTGSQKSKMAALKPKALIVRLLETPTVTPRSSESRNTIGVMAKLSDVRMNVNLEMATISGNRYANAYISTCK